MLATFGAKAEWFRAGEERLRTTTGVLPDLLCILEEFVFKGYLNICQPGATTSFGQHRPQGPRDCRCGLYGGPSVETRKPLPRGAGSLSGVQAEAGKLERGKWRGARHAILLNCCHPPRVANASSYQADVGIRQMLQELPELIWSH